jgi:hypothetical protein
VGTAEGVLLIYEVKEKPGVDGTATFQRRLSARSCFLGWSEREGVADG